MKRLLLFVVIHAILRPVRSANGVIWNKRIQNFVPIFSVPVFASINREKFDRSRAEETHNFQGQIVTFTYYKLSNVVFPEANGTQVDGRIGKIWNILAEYLNFTLKPIITNYHTMGHLNPNGTLTPGLLAILNNNETDVIARMGIHAERFRIGQFSFPLWKTSHYLYIQPEMKHDSAWMAKLFTRQTWFAILVTYLLLSFCGYLAQLMDSNTTREELRDTWYDHLFYNFSLICNQLDVPSTLNKNSVFILFWSGVFSSLLRTAFSALLLVYLKQTITHPPFYDMETLVRDTSYTVLAEKGTRQSITLQYSNYSVYLKLRERNQVKHMDDRTEMYKLACSTKNKYAVYQSEDVKQTSGEPFCQLNPVRNVEEEEWISSGISWNFKYKRSIDIALLKLEEVGLMAGGTRYWTKWKPLTEDASDDADDRPINMQQIALILSILGYASATSFVLFVFEILIFYYRN
ncbi:uncharacterized protein LOC128894238 [Hylaeus anthracinus]|uniref:uncharacterized protein LOC128894238 n=1 Tax=Hylaeus anthracinus TaxID=313031 RepID=UPI0023B915C0|nr:uncharacterized protein LOC128894238 [Hylaeus anthracinus]